MSAKTIRRVPWRPGDPQALIETFSRSSLFGRVDAARLDEYERAGFHMVQLGRSGVGLHEVDFVDVEMRPGRVLHIEPGQVHRWSIRSNHDATLLLFRRAPRRLALDWSLGPRVVDLSPSQVDSVDDILRLLAVERASTRSVPATATAMEALRDLAVVRLGLLDAGAGDVAATSPPYSAFRGDLEAHLDVRESMQRRAARLGYSARTISRACVRATGRTAKQLADHRLALEARRLLSQPDATAARAGSALGFTEPTNFAKFFRRTVGQRPSDWMAQLGSDPS